MKKCESKYFDYKMNGVISLLLICFCTSIALSESTTTHQTLKMQTDDTVALQRVFYNDAWDEGFTKEKGLRERRITKAANAAKGLIVMEKLLTGATKVKTTKHARFYRKNGDRQTALNDFNSVQPVVNRPNIDYMERRRQGEILIGRVGDRRLTLMLDWDHYHRHRGHSTVLEIRSATDGTPDIIVYKRDK